MLIIAIFGQRHPISGGQSFDFPCGMIRPDGRRALKRAQKHRVVSRDPLLTFGIITSAETDLSSNSQTARYVTTSILVLKQHKTAQ